MRTPIVVERETCQDFAQSSKIEWLETNGTGAFAMGTAAGVNTRRYHALLVASLKPPVERRVLLARLEEEASFDGKTFALAVAQYPGTVAPRGFELLEEFRPEPCATWIYSLDGVKFEKQVYLVPGKQAVMVRYRAERDVSLRVRIFLAGRDYHSLRHGGGDFYMNERVDYYCSGKYQEDLHWYYDNEYLTELDRGLDFREDLFTPGYYTIDLRAGVWEPFCASIQGPQTAEPPVVRDPFVVRRADGKPTIIAGYPWFTDWGRDTMISLPGLLITPGRLDEARAILEGFLAHMNQGIVPNRFPDAGETPEYNTADATLWMFQAVRQWLAAGGSRGFLRNVFYPQAKEIIEWHRKGTWYGIQVDSSDQLLNAGSPGTQLTWMDARVGDRVMTPRHGKAVEINALWHGALVLMAEWARELGDASADDFAGQAAAVKDSFREKFWNAERNCLYDTIQEHGPVAKIRPNQVFAVSLKNGLIENERQRAVVEMVQRELLTPVGLRTLEAGDPEYQGRYQGPPWERDAAYHQGTVWPWLIGPFVDAYLAAFGKTDATLAYCAGLLKGLDEESAKRGCLGSVAEIYDGDEPRVPRGCPAQAWSVAEIARVRAEYGLGYSNTTSTDPSEPKSARIASPASAI
jgi:glycogen debranching enzyme